jgi:hypothetical protein
VAWALGLALLAAPAELLGQQPLPPGWFGMEGFVPFPSGGEFTDLRAPRGGIELFVAAYLGARRRWGFRLEVSSATRSNGPRFDSPLGTLAVQNQYDLTAFTAGPQVATALGPFHLHAHGAIGLSHSKTDAQIRRTLNDSILLARTMRTTTFAYGGEVGAMIPVATIHGFSSDIRVAITTSAAYLLGGTVRYLSPRGTAVNPDGSISAAPERTKTGAALLRLGVSLGFTFDN